MSAAGFDWDDSEPFRLEGIIDDLYDELDAVGEDEEPETIPAPPARGDETAAAEVPTADDAEAATDAPADGTEAAEDELEEDDETRIRRECDEFVTASVLSEMEFDARYPQDLSFIEVGNRRVEEALAVPLNPRFDPLLWEPTNGGLPPSVRNTEAMFRAVDSFISTRASLHDPPKWTPQVVHQAFEDAALAGAKRPFLATINVTMYKLLYPDEDEDEEAAPAAPEDEARYLEQKDVVSGKRPLGKYRRFIMHRRQSGNARSNAPRKEEDGEDEEARSHRRGARTEATE